MPPPRTFRSSVLSYLRRLSFSHKTHAYVEKVHVLLVICATDTKSPQFYYSLCISSLCILFFSPEYISYVDSYDNTIKLIYKMYYRNCGKPYRVPIRQKKVHRRRDDSVGGCNRPNRSPIVVSFCTKRPQNNLPLAVKNL